MREIFIWLGWQSEIRPAVFVLTGWTILTVLTYTPLHFGLRTWKGSIEPGVIVLIALIAICLSLFILAVIVNTWGDKKKNWRVAAHRAWKRAKEKGIIQNHALYRAYRDTQKTKDPAIVNDWMEDYEKWEKAEKELEKMEKELKELPRRIINKVEMLKALEKRLFT